MLRDFNDLQFFIAVVQNHGFSSGARALGVPKSRVSRRVALFEERLGVRLLDRGARGVSLTEIWSVAVRSSSVAARASRLATSRPRSRCSLTGHGGVVSRQLRRSEPDDSLLEERDDGRRTAADRRFRRRSLQPRHPRIPGYEPESSTGCLIRRALSRA